MLYTNLPNDLFFKTNIFLGTLMELCVVVIMMIERGLIRFVKYIKLKLLIIPFFFHIMYIGRVPECKYNGWGFTQEK